MDFLGCGINYHPLTYQSHFRIVSGYQIQSVKKFCDHTSKTILTLIFLVLVIFFALVLGAQVHYTSYKICFNPGYLSKLRLAINTSHTTTKSKFSFASNYSLYMCCKTMLIIIELT